jgi:hypothetical protein
MKQRIYPTVTLALCTLALALLATPGADAQPGQVLRAEQVPLRFPAGR